MHVMETTTCRKGREHIRLNMRNNNHRNDVRNPNPKTILACKHFQEKNHNINIQNSILQTHLAAQKKPQRNSATTLN